MRAATLLLTAAAASLPTALAFLSPVPPSSSSSALARAGRAFSTPPRAAAFIEVEKTTGGGSGEEDENSRGGGGRGGGRATVITERAWNASTLGALPVDLEGLSKAICDCALTAVANGEMGLTVHAGGEFEAGNKYYDPYQFTSLVVAMAAKLSVLGNTRVLFAGPEQLEQSLDHMRQLIQLEARKEQEELATVAQVRREVQARFPGRQIPEMPQEMLKAKAAKQQERRRLAERVAWGSLLGSYRLTGDAVTDLEMAPSAVFGEVDMENDRLFLIAAPGASPAEMLAVRKLVKAVGRHQPVIVLNHRFDPEPLEFSVFTAAYHLDICKLKRPKPDAVYLPSELEEEVYDPFTGPKGGLGFSDKQRGQGQEQQAIEEVETVLVRRFPDPWQVYGNFNTPAAASTPEAADPSASSSSSSSTQQPQEAQAPPPAVVESFELVDTYDGRPTPEAMRARVLAAAEARSPLDPRAAKRTRRG